MVGRDLCRCRSVDSLLPEMIFDLFPPRARSYRSCQRYRSQPGGCIERSRSSEAARNHQPIAALPGNAENVWSALSGLYRKRAEDRPIGISASQSISHSRNLRATPYQTHHSTMGEISTLSRGIEGCRGVVSGTTQGERSEEGET